MARPLTVGAALVVAVTVVVSGQTFEVASIKAAPPPTGDGVSIRMSVDAARYSLAAGKSGIKLPKAEKANGLNSDTGRLCSRVNGEDTMLEFTDFLSKRLARPVVDNTGLEGAFKFAMEWAPDDSVIDGTACGPSLTTALQEQLGLKLNADRGPVEILVIDHLDRKPTEN